MSTMIKNVIQGISEAAEAIKSTDTQHFPEAASVGDWSRQGDIYIEVISEVPKNAERNDGHDVQLAIGDTIGARHVLDSKVGITIYTASSEAISSVVGRNIPDDLIGPILSLAPDADRTITHPQHGDQVLPSGKTYLITYQGTYESEQRRRRVMD